MNVSSTPGDDQPPKTESSDTPSSLLDSLYYGLSLPERTVRGLSAVTGGLIHETAARLIPAAFRNSKSYSLFIQQSLDMAIHDFGGVPNTRLAEQAENSDEQGLLARKAVGGLLDVAGMATLHLSPMTVLAVFSDLAYGSSHYLQQLSAELKSQGVIDKESSVDHVSDLLAALQQASERATDALDRPPLNITGLRDTIQQTTDALNGVDPNKLIPQSEISRIWDEMEQAAVKANVGILDVSATMALFAVNRLTLVTRGALSTIGVTGNLLDQHIFDHYGEAIEEIRTVGLYSTLKEASAPYYDAVWHNFSTRPTTWTEDLLSGRLVEKSVDSLRGWWSSASDK